MRTIVNGRQHPTEKLAEYVESQLEEANQSLKSYVQDTTDFLRKLSTVNQPLSNSSILFCMDVKALYPSIPRQEAREVIAKVLNQRQKKEVDTNTILQMMDAVLENNNFSFNNKQYIQTEGTAIGSKLGRNYACVYMGDWERILLEQCNVQPLFYVRYIDDIFGIWSGTEADLLHFHEMANGIHPNIQLDLRFSKSSIEFLDVNVSIEKGYLSTDLYSKPTDKHMYLNKKSSHPESTKKSIPFGLGIRARRICSTDEGYFKQREKIKTNLRKCGYSNKDVEDQLAKVDKLNRSDLLNYRKNNKKCNRVPFVLNYSRGLPNIHQILKKRQQILENSDRLKLAFHNTPIVAFRRDKNLKDILVHKKHNNLFFKKQHLSEPCGAKKMCYV